MEAILTARIHHIPMDLMDLIPRILADPTDHILHTPMDPMEHLIHHTLPMEARMDRMDLILPRIHRTCRATRPIPNTRRHIPRTRRPTHPSDHTLPMHRGQFGIPKPSTM
ncbi:hypothetical protein Q1695_006834 [Nippostrongylus brasiliensis]|nr:hypothetical protein Q1695_006834 [Nippostrongylus brasiliensis]